jgi:hypothetical protein
MKSVDVGKNRPLLTTTISRVLARFRFPMT